MVNARLTARCILLRFRETLQQSVSGNSCGRTVSPPEDCSMSSPAVSTAAVRKALRRFRRNRRGSAAVEFALVAPVFFALLFAIIETAIVFFASQVLETITQDSARMIMTGQAQTAGLHARRSFKTLCLRPDSACCSTASTASMSTCRAIPRFSSVTITDPIDASSNFINNMQYSPGGRRQHRRGAAVLSMAAVRHRAWLQHLESGRQQAAAGRHGRVPQRAFTRRRLP